MSWYGPNDRAILNGGLRVADTIVVDWMTNQGVQVAGGRLEVYREGKRLRWLPSGFCRDAGGMCVFVPYLTTRDDAEEFVRLVGLTTGHKVVEEVSSRPSSCRFRLASGGDDLYKLSVGDELHLDMVSKVFKLISRPDPLLGSKIQKGDAGEWLIFQRRLPYMTAVHHPHVIARVIAEANGLSIKPNGTPSSFLFC